MPEPMFARWDDVEARVLDAAEGVLAERDPMEGPLNDWEIKWALKTAKKIVQATMMHLDGWTPEDIADEHSAASSTERS